VRINSLKKNKSKEEFQRKTERARWKKMEFFALSSFLFDFSLMQPQTNTLHKENTTTINNNNNL